MSEAHSAELASVEYSWKIHDLTLSFLGAGGMTIVWCAQLPPNICELQITHGTDTLPKLSQVYWPFQAWHEHHP